MDFWKKWLHSALTILLTVSLLSPAATTANAEETDAINTMDGEVTVDALNSENANQDGINVEDTTVLEGVTSNNEADVIVQNVAVTEVINLIENLPAIKSISEKNALALKQARAAYDALTEEEKALVTNSATLVEKENAYNALLVVVKNIVIDDSYRAVLSPKYAKDTKSYTLGVPTEFKTIKLAVTTNSEDVKVSYAIGNTAYEAGAEIPVKNNTTLTITTEIGDAKDTISIKFNILKAVSYKVDFRVEGVSGTVLNVKDFEVKGDGKVTAAQATKQILDANNIEYEYRASSDYFKSIGGDGEKALGAGSGWMYKVNGTYPDVYSSAIDIQAEDEIVWDYINSSSVVKDYDEYKDYGFVMYSGAESVDKITFNPIITMPTAVTEGQDVNVKVTGKYNTVTYLYEHVSGPDTVDLADVTIEYNGKKYVTDKNGEVTISAEDVVAGSYELRFSKDLPGVIFTDNGEKNLDSFPRIIRTYKTLLVAPKELASGNRQKAEDTLKLAAKYLTTNSDKVSARVNESHSGFWMLTAMKAAGLNVAAYPWTTSPTTAGTFWTTNVEAPLKDSNTIAGSIIAAKALGLDPTTLKGRNQIADLLAIQKPTQLFSTIWGEAFAVIALELTDAQYEQQKHIDAILKLQSASGYFGDVDATGWTLFALSAFKDQPAVKEAIDKAVAAYHKDFLKNGFTDNANSMAAIISGLASVGEDVFSEKWTYKKDDEYVNIVGYLVDHYVMEDGGVLYKASQSASNLMALEQVYVALADAVNGKSTFYTLNEAVQTPAPTEKPNTGDNGGGNSTDVPTIPTDAKVSMSIEASAKEVILPSEQFNIQADETAFDLLKRVTQAKNIALNARQTSMGMYVAGIAGINEFDRGNLSGWMFSVNGTYPEVSADAYKLKSGDVVKWSYTSNLGADVGGGTSGGGSSTVETPTTSTEYTVEDLAKKDEIVVKDETGIEILIPTTGIKLKENEKLAVAMVKTDNKVQVVLEIVAADGSKKTLQATKAYAKVSFALNTTNAVVLQEVDGQYVAVPHTVVDGKATVLTKTGGTFIVSNETVTFADIAKLSNKDEIEFLANRHVVNGSNGAFMPYSNITRAQFAMMIARALDLQAVGENPFTDTVGKEYEDAATALYEAGITTGTTATTFSPATPVTRQQAAAMMARVLAYVGQQPKTTTALTYTDADTIGASFKDSVALLVQLNIMTGKPDGSFDPHGYLTRAQMAKILKRTLNAAGLM